MAGLAGLEKIPELPDTGRHGRLALVAPTTALFSAIARPLVGRGIVGSRGILLGWPALVLLARCTRLASRPLKTA